MQLSNVLTSGTIPPQAGSRVERVRVVNVDQPEHNHRFYPTNRITNTKYTLLTFLPKNLYEQFSRFMNIYFLGIALLQLWSAVTPVDPITTWGPLVFIFAVSAIKEAVDDINRHRADKQANERLVCVVRGGIKVHIQAQHILVGDIIFLRDGEEIPCDCVLLKTSAEDGTCYVQTANIDGEIDLKPRSARIETQRMERELIHRFKGVIECPPPNDKVYSFDARMKLFPASEEYLPLSPQNMILQATHLRNTDWAYGACVYTGNQTKIGQNKRTPPTKWTKLDRFINRLTIFIFILQLSLAVIFGLVGDIWQSKYAPDMWYLDYDHRTWWDWIVIPLRFLLLMSLMIPISLKVTLDVIKYIYALFIGWDLQMYDEVTDTPAAARNTSISEDLGQIEYVFSDKTGTLTENNMVFSKCSIRGRLYGHSLQSPSALADPLLQRAVVESSDSAECEFLRALALCNSVMPSSNELHENSYRASSPDEEALVNAARYLGVVLTARDQKTVDIVVNGRLERYDWLYELAFTSERKRMAVIVRNRATGVIQLYAKGADDVIIPRLAPLAEERTVARETASQLEMFAGLGLRTMVVATRTLDPEEFVSVDTALKTAALALHNRTERLEEAYSVAERNMVLLGVTAIEDRLQQDVPDTISALREAGINVWMLTGDKQSTAVQIALSANLISPPPEGELLTVSGRTHEEVAASLAEHCARLKQLQAENKRVAVVIDGAALHMALDHHQASFAELALAAHSVICCRVTPHQKALVVRFVKNRDRMTLAIGDGGNDVGMIQEAHIGVGIAGREGLQAARASDYSFAKFRFLRRLLLVHGRWSYRRTAFVALYSFYKSLFIAFLQLLYAFYSGFSGTSFLDSFVLMSWNILFTSLPILCFVLDRDLPDAILMHNPRLYAVETQRGVDMNVLLFVFWFARALVQALIAFFITIASFTVQSVFAADASPIDYESLSVVTYTAGVWIQTLTIVLESHSLTWVNHVVIWGTCPVMYYVATTIYNAIPAASTYYAIFHVFGDLSCWLATLLIVTVAMLPIVVLKYFSFNYFARPYQKLQHAEVAKRSRRMRSQLRQSDSLATPLLQYGAQDEGVHTDLLSASILLMTTPQFVPTVHTDAPSVPLLSETRPLARYSALEGTGVK